MSGFLTAEQAIELFDTLSSMDDLEHGYVTDGCYARTHLMCRYLEDRGISSSKAWLIEDRAKTMTPHIPGSPEELKTEGFYYHVAPCVSVEKPDGEIVDMVFDPSFFDGPADLDEWAFVIDVDPPYVEVKEFGTAPEGYKDSYRIISAPMYVGDQIDEDARASIAENAQKLADADMQSQRRSVFRSELRSALSQDILSMGFANAGGAGLNVVDAPDNERVRPLRYWEVDPDDLDSVFYD